MRHQQRDDRGARLLRERAVAEDGSVQQLLRLRKTTQRELLRLRLRAHGRATRGLCSGVAARKVRSAAGRASHDAADSRVRVRRAGHEHQQRGVWCWSHAPPMASSPKPSHVPVAAAAARAARFARRHRHWPFRGSRVEAEHRSGNVLSAAALLPRPQRHVVHDAQHALPQQHHPPPPSRSISPEVLDRCHPARMPRGVRRRDR